MAKDKSKSSDTKHKHICPELFEFVEILAGQAARGNLPPLEEKPPKRSTERKVRYKFDKYVDRE